jgi:hypothetical protein
MSVCTRCIPFVRSSLPPTTNQPPGRQPLTTPTINLNPTHHPNLTASAELDLHDLLEQYTSTSMIEGYQTP